MGKIMASTDGTGENQMDGLKVIYKDADGVALVSLPDGRYYYGNGKTFGGFGVAPNQFLRFNPYMEWVEEQNLEVPEAVKKWINENA